MDMNKMAATALRLVNKNGRGIILQRLDQAPNPAQPWKGPANPSPEFLRLPVRAVVVSAGSLLGARMVSDDLLRRVEKVAIVAPGPDMQDDLKVYGQVIDETVTWSAEWVEELKPADVRMLYYFGLKR